MQRRNVTAVLALVMLCVLLSPRTARSAGVETLLMPGPVSAAHAGFEEDCSQCHDRTRRQQQPQRCLACHDHEAIATDIRDHQGFHGRIQGIEHAQCVACHSEHHGRDADIAKLIPAQFDHRLSDFELLGAHLTLPCASCHEAAQSHRNAAATCEACHRPDDPHEGRLGTDCGRCHGATSWAEVRFDHEQTRFALRDRHRSVPCAACHFDNRWQDTPVACVSCHAPDDVHRGERGTTCADCHTAASWQTSRFDHDRETDFPLIGAHRHADCKSCHASGRFDDELPKDCHGCHRARDDHAGRLGTDCASCHDAQEWQTTRFDHTHDGKWALAGRHAEVACHSCHTAQLAAQKLTTDCVSCHRAQDVHRGELGSDCVHCHLVDGWQIDIAFDHDLSDFPLVGLHVVVPCEQCHLTRAYKGTKTDCHDCHQAADKHVGALGPDCGACHSPNGWGIWEFDHGKATGYELTGAHSSTSCAGCHKLPPSEQKPGTDCVGCHAHDDVHFGQYGRQCQRCHTTNSFSRVRLQ